MLTPKQIKFYQDNGYLHVKGLISRGEAKAYRKECHDLAARLQAKSLNIDATWGSASKAVSKKPKTQILHCHDVQFHSAAFGQLILDDRFTSAASEVMGTPNVQLHHTKMFIKPPEKGSPFPLHQDWPYFPHKNDSMIAAIFFFDDAPEEKGCLGVMPGSHKLGRLEHDPEGGWHLNPKKWPLKKSTLCPAKAGDVVFFSYLTIHGSGLNVSNEARTTVLVQLRDPEDVPTVDTHNSRGQGMLLRGIDPTASPCAPH